MQIKKEAFLKLLNSFELIQNSTGFGTVKIIFIQNFINSIDIETATYRNHSNADSPSDKAYQEYLKKLSENNKESFHLIDVNDLKNLIELGAQTLPFHLINKTIEIILASKKMEYIKNKEKVYGLTEEIRGVLREFDPEIKEIFLSSLLEAKQEFEKFISWWESYEARRKNIGSLREKILRRDCYKCIMCGSTIEPEVDYIEEVIDGGESVSENLQTLCHICHVKKHFLKDKKGNRLDSYYYNMIL